MASYRNAEHEAVNSVFCGEEVNKLGASYPNFQPLLAVNSAHERNPPSVLDGSYSLFQPLLAVDSGHERNPSGVFHDRGDDHWTHELASPDSRMLLSPISWQNTSLDHFDAVDEALLDSSVDRRDHMSVSSPTWSPQSENDADESELNTDWQNTEDPLGLSEVHIPPLSPAVRGESMTDAPCPVAVLATDRADTQMRGEVGGCEAYPAGGRSASGRVISHPGRRPQERSLHKQAIKAAVEGDVDTLLNMLAFAPRVLDHVNKNRETAGHIAVRAGAWNSIQALVRAAPSLFYVRDKRGRLPADVINPSRNGLVIAHGFHFSRDDC